MYYILLIFIFVYISSKYQYKKIVPLLSDPNITSYEYVHIIFCSFALYIIGTCWPEFTTRRDPWIQDPKKGFIK